MTKKEALQRLSEIEELSNKYSLSDDYLEEKNSTTRQDVGIGGDYLYGIIMVPESLVIDMCKALIKDEANKRLAEYENLGFTPEEIKKMLECGAKTAGFPLSDFLQDDE